MSPSSAAGARMPLISGNWKMHKNHLDALRTIQQLSYLLTDEDHEAVAVSVHAPFTDLRTLQTWIESEKDEILLGAQHCHWETEGAFTGEVAAPMLAKLGCSLVIVGHSERRELFGETDEQVAAKAAAVLAADMTPIVCVGETLEEREQGATSDKVVGQVQAALGDLDAEVVGTLVVAYEPIWAIGTGRTASSEDAQEVCGLIRATVAEMAGDAAAAGLRIQYGGSVKPANIADLMAQDDIDGALVGGASLEAEDFARIVQYRLQG
jgi:triosephosphate isomerase (TIM)